MAKISLGFKGKEEIDTLVETYMRYGHKRTKISCGSATCKFYTHIIINLGNIQGIHYPDLPIPVGCIAL